MQVWTQLERHEHLFHAGVITIGNFDGVHLGHQCLLRKAAEVGRPRIVMTFDPHPLQVLHPGRQLKRLFPRADLLQQLPQYGVDLLVLLPFDREFARQSAEEFLRQCVGEVFHPRSIVAGYDFAFGKEREGTLDYLRLWGGRNSIQVEVLPPLQVDGEVVSSRRIREAILGGDVQSAQRWLGRPFYLRGEVIQGAGRGSQIGIPTLNQKVVNETLPPTGVYVTRTVSDGRPYPSITNIGTNPTFGGTLLKVETHVLDQRVEWRGRSVDVELIDRLRDERKFADVESLKRQIESDIVQARERLRQAL